MLCVVLTRAELAPRSAGCWTSNLRRWTWRHRSCAPACTWCFLLARASSFLPSPHVTLALLRCMCIACCVAQFCIRGAAQAAPDREQSTTALKPRPNSQPQGQHT